MEPQSATLRKCHQNLAHIWLMTGIYNDGKRLHLMRHSLSFVRFLVRSAEFETSWFSEVMEDVKLLCLQNSNEQRCRTNAKEWSRLEALMTDDSAVDTNTSNVLEKRENLVLNCLVRRRRVSQYPLAECCEFDADAEKRFFQSRLLHRSSIDALRHRLLCWYKSLFYIRHELAFSFYNRRWAGLLFCMQKTDYTK